MSMMLPGRLEGQRQLSGLMMTSVRSSSGEEPSELSMMFGDSAAKSAKIFSLASASSSVGGVITAGSK